MTDIPRRYKKSGLTQEEYVKMSMADSFLTTVSPERFTSNIEAILKHYSDLGMTENDLIKTLKKQRVIVTSSSTSVIKKLDLWRFIEENKLADADKTMDKKDFKDLILRKNLSHSIESNLLYLLRCKLNSFYGTKMPAKKIKEPLVEFLRQNSDKIFEIPVLNGNFVEQFERVISEFSTKILNKNIFRVVVK